MAGMKIIGKCWVWQRALKAPNSYGAIRIEGVTKRVHRVSYTEYKGAIPKDMCVMHTCDVPACINPKHLVLGTQLENLADMRYKKRHHVFVIKHGESIPSAKLTSIEANEIKELLSIGVFTQKEIAGAYGVSPTTVSHINLGMIWN